VAGTDNSISAIDISAETNEIARNFYNTNAKSRYLNA
jgi:hypothetical protein